MRGVSLHVDKGEVLAIVGESGCGKSVTAQTIMKLNPMPPARIVSGEIRLGEHDIVAASDKEMQAIRGREVSMIFQDPMTCMNPTMQVGKQIVEAIKLHRKLSAEEAKEEAIRCLKQVNIPNPEERAKQYPHEFSGGMRQRAMIAMALSCDPKLLIADEPTTALDVTIQAQIMDLLGELKDQINTAIILITHDLGVVAGSADRVAVMYAGKVVETGSTEDIFYRNAHPYTQALLKSLVLIFAYAGMKPAVPGNYERLRVESYEILRVKRKQLDKAEKRILELDKLFVRIYEDNVAGKLSDERFSVMSSSYEEEQQALKTNAEMLRQEIEVQEQQNQNLELFIQKVHQYADLDELTAYAAHDLIKAIYIGAPDKSSGKRRQSISICYDFVGFIPLDELLKQETA